jgi:hypothetical protein
MFENYSNIYSDSNKYANYGVSKQEKKFLKKARQQNLQNKYGLSGFSNSTIDNNIGGLISNSNIEAFGSMNQTQFLQSPPNPQNPQTLSGMNLGLSPANPATNPYNAQNVTLQQINNQIQSLNNQNKLQAYNPKNPLNNLTTYSKQSEAVVSQNKLTDADIANLKSLTSEYNQLVQEYNQAQTSVMNNADNEVLSMNSTTNPYLGQNLEISGGQVYYITNAGIAQPYDEYSPIQLQNYYQNNPQMLKYLSSTSNNTNTPTTVNSTSAINATVYDSDGTNYISTTPAMQVGNPKIYGYSSGYEGTNVYSNNSQPLSFTDASYSGCYNFNASQQQLMPLAPGSSNNNYTFQTCQQVAYDSGSGYFSFNVSSPGSQTGNCYLSNSWVVSSNQCPAVNYTYKKLWSTNITPTGGIDMSNNYMSLDPAGNIVIYNSSNMAIWSSDNSNNSLGTSNYIGCYQSSVNIPVTTDVMENQITYNTSEVCIKWVPDGWDWRGAHPNYTCQNWAPPGTIPNGKISVSTPQTTNDPTQTMQDVTNSSNNTWESCYQYAYNNGNSYFGVSNFNPANGTSNCLVSNSLSVDGTQVGGAPNSCSLEDQLYYGGNGSNAVYSATNAPLNAFLTLQDNGIVTAFTGTTLYDVQNITWQLDMSGQTQMPNCQIATDPSYMYMQTGQWLYEGQIFSSPTGMAWLTMQGGNLVLYTSTNTSKCYGMTTNQNQTYYAGDGSMNALYSMNNTGDSNSLGNIGYVDENSVLYRYPQNLVGQGNTFTYMGNYDSSGSPITDLSSNTGSIYFTGLDLSGAMQKCIDLSCNAFVGYNGNSYFKFMQTAFATPTYSYSDSNYLARYPNANAQLYLRNPTVNNSPYCNKSITGVNSSLYSNYKTSATPMNSSNKCVTIKTKNRTLEMLDVSLNNLSTQLSNMQNNLMKKTMTINQQEQLNEIILGRQFKEINAVQAVQKQFKQNAVNAQNIKNDSNIVVLRENQSYTLWSVLAISIALISIHVIR